MTREMQILQDINKKIECQQHTFQSLLLLHSYVTKVDIDW